ncbi:MAG: IS4 family transposase [Acidobacteriia bacterium]|nr:IS4 family transposase [Terriglobia bacterium]
MLSLFQHLLTVEFFQQLQKEKHRQNNRIYNHAVVMWLMIVQRLQGHGTLETAVLELVRGLPSSFWPNPCKRLQEDSNGQKPRLSGNTASYNDARQALPGSIVEQSFDRTLVQLTEQMSGTVPALGQRAFFYDGTTARTARTEALCADYPPGCNQHGEGHFPLIRMVVAHDLHTGLAMRPEWGPVYGPQAVSEQALMERSMDRLPNGSVVVYDANSCFSVAYAADQRGHGVVLRLTEARAQRLLGGPLRDEIDRHLVWKPSRDDRKSHPQLPADAAVAGRLIVRRVQPSDGSEAFRLALFTTLEAEVDPVVSLYGGRWNIETDLRSLKGTLELEQLTCTTTEMVAKELNLAMLAYNLVRAMTYQAAQKSGLPPRAFSFTRVRNVIRAFGPLIAAAQDEQEAQELCEKMMYYVGQAKLPQRRERRTSYPRAVWGRPQTFPRRKA